MTTDGSDVTAGTDGVLPTDDPEPEHVETITFAEWRRARPFAGGLLLVVGGLLIAWPSLAVVFSTQPFDAYPTASLGTIVGAAIAFAGVAALVRPEYARVLGVVGLVLASVSFVVAFGGYLIGMVVASAGGILAFAWTPTEEYERLILGDADGTERKE
ncbi:DUF6114 domain-containing protein [Halorientalis halophila]|uniref:DUF6114 domain-containing protein n=1 Tax=Halorientalis halophila TaxID=3108499 RepID=UPI00300809F9